MFEELKTFVAVVEHLNFTKAAEFINLSQPSVSLHIKHLEEYFGVTLINRSSRKKKILITPAGELLYKRAKKIISTLEQTAIELNEFQHGYTGTLRIGASFTIGEYILPNLLSEYAKLYPNVQIEVTIGNTATISKLVNELKLDLGLIEGREIEIGLHRENFYEDTLHVVISSKDLSQFQPFSKDKLQDQTWISREDGSGTAEYFKQFLLAHGIIPKNITVFGSNYAVKEAVKYQLGIAFISSLVTQESESTNELHSLSSSLTISRPFSYIYPQDTILVKTTLSFIDYLKTFMNK